MDKVTKKIGFIGAGNMAQAILAGILAKKVVRKEQIICSDVSDACCETVTKKYGITATSENQMVVENADILLLCVKPQDGTTILADIKNKIGENHTIISIMAGVSLPKIETLVGAACPVIRAMPNLAALVQESATAIVANEKANVDDAFIKDTMTIFNAVGKTIRLYDERLMDVVTGLSGSGPAYALMAVQAMTVAATGLGMNKEDAQLLANQTLLGASKMCMETGVAPEVLIDRISSPGGTTLAGREALEKHGFSDALIAAVKAAAKRSKELGRA